MLLSLFSSKRGAPSRTTVAKEPLVYEFMNKQLDVP